MVKAGYLKLIVLLFFALSGCLSYTDITRQMRTEFAHNDYATALDVLEKSSLAKDEDNRLLYLMEKASIQDRMGELKKSRQLLLDAERLSDELVTVSVTKTAATFVVNESVSEYSGEIYEKVATHVLLALSFLEEKDIKSARVEAKKINNKLYEITQNLGAENNSYTRDGMALVLSGMIYEALGNWDDAIIDLSQALSLYKEPNYRRFYNGVIPKPLIESLFRVASMRNRTKLIAELREEFPKIIQEQEDKLKNPKQGVLVVVHEAGRIAYKKAKEFVIPIGNQVVRASFPYIEFPYFSKNGGTGFTLISDQAANQNLQKDYNGALLVNMSAIAHYVLEEQRGRILAKGIARLATKGFLVNQAHKNYGPLAGIVANVFTAASETADTRSWTLLPDNFYLTRAVLPAGSHKIQIQTEGRVGEYQTVSIQPGQVSFLRVKN